MSFFQLAGTAHERAASRAIASARKSAQRKPAAAARAVPAGGRSAAALMTDDAPVDESQFARF
jgi:hypothetical protein